RPEARQSDVVGTSERVVNWQFEASRVRECGARQAEVPGCLASDVCPATTLDSRPPHALGEPQLIVAGRVQAIGHRLIEPVEQVHYEVERSLQVSRHGQL